jgi:hypothetical protein
MRKLLYHLFYDMADHIGNSGLVNIQQKNLKIKDIPLNDLNNLINICNKENHDMPNINDDVKTNYDNYYLISLKPLFRNVYQDNAMPIDQLISGFTKYIFPKEHAEVYFEYGRRDHAVDWREFLLNPEHARAYLLGFRKLISLPNDAYFQVNGEILQQQESINIMTRYRAIGGSSWGSHGIRQGFTHQGQMLGPGVGPSSNVQTLETSWVKGVKKLGVRWERLNRHQDVYTRIFNDPSENGRWVDYSARLLADWQWANLLLSSTGNVVYSLNPQGDLASPDFHSTVFSFTTRISNI